MIPDAIELRQPLWLLTALLPVLFLMTAYILRRWKKTDYTEPHLRPWVVSQQRSDRYQRLWRLVMIQLAWLGFSIALAGPRLAEQVAQHSETIHANLLVAVDLSRSMSARDIKPSRIQRVKLELHDLVSRLQHTRMGIVVFAAQPHILIPPTHDKSVLRHYIDLLDTGLLPSEGSDIDSMLNKLFTQMVPGSSASNTILLVSDGEHQMHAQQLDDHFNSINLLLKQHNVRLFVLGVGTEQGSALLTEQTGWLTVDGVGVTSRINRQYLTTLAGIGHGAFAEVSDDDSDWRTLYTEGIARLAMPQASRADDRLTQWRELFSVFLLTGLLCLLASLVRFNVARTNTGPLIMALGFLPILLAMPDTLASEQGNDDIEYRAGYRNFEQGEYQKAIKHFANVSGYRGRFAEGGVHYQLNQYTRAVPLFIQAILEAESDEQRGQAIFNLANSYFKLDEYQTASQLYQDVLHYQPDNRQATINLDYALALIPKGPPDNTKTAQRQGRGPRTAPAPDNMDITSGRLSLGDREPNEQANPQAPTLESVSPPSALLDQSRPASEQIHYDKDTTWTYDITHLDELKQTNPVAQHDESTLWRRLFEVEEGYAAPQERPNVLPGVKPW